MGNIKDILIESFEQSGLIETISPARVLLSILCAFICGVIIYAVYKLFFRGPVYSENFGVLLILTTVVTGFVIVTISSNLVLSLGMVGALSIVRFRAAIKDPLDIGFLFWGIAAGLTSGAGLFPIALIGTAVISVIYALVCVFAKGRKTFLLVVRYDSESEKAVEDALSEIKYLLKSKTVSDKYSELTASVKIGRDSSLVSKIKGVEGVKSASLVEYTGDVI